MKKDMLYYINLLVMIFIIVLGLVVAYQLVLKILGGSWMSESLIIALLVMNISLSFANAINLAKLGSDHRYLRRQFGCLARDFKEHVGGHIK